MPPNKKVVKVTFMGYWCLSCPWYIILCILWSHHILLVAPKLGLEVNPILHGGIKWIPRLIIVHQSSWNALKGLIFHDFVPFNIRKVLGRPFLGFLFLSSYFLWEHLMLLFYHLGNHYATQFLSLVIGHLELQ